jgi:hypothetical protein
MQCPLFKWSGNSPVPGSQRKEQNLSGTLVMGPLRGRLEEGLLIGLRNPTIR